MNGLHTFEHGGNVHQAIRENGGALQDLLDFSANINPLGLANSVRQVIMDKVDDIIHYPDATAYAIKQAISLHYQVPENTITPGNGAVELLYLLCHLLKPRQVLIPAPSFSEYERAAHAVQAKVKYIYMAPEQNFTLSISAIKAQLPQTDILFLGNPNNPTGTLLPAKIIEPLLQHAMQTGTWIVVDESFMDFLLSDQEYTCRPLLRMYQNLIIIHSLTKFYAIPGLRLGFALTAAKLTKQLHAAKDPWNVNLLAQYAGVAALQDISYQTASKSFINETKSIFCKGLAELPKCKFFAPSVNYVLLDISQTGLTAASLREKLFTNHQILIRDCSNYPGLSNNFVRVAIKQPCQNQKLLLALQQIFTNGGEL